MVTIVYQRCRNIYDCLQYEHVHIVDDVACRVDTEKNRKLTYFTATISIVGTRQYW